MGVWDSQSERENHCPTNVQQFWLGYHPLVFDQGWRAQGTKHKGHMALQRMRQRFQVLFQLIDDVILHVSV